LGILDRGIKMKKILLFILFSTITLTAQLRQDQVRNLPDSLDSHNDKINAQTDSINIHRAFMNANRDSIRRHTDSLLSHNLRLLAIYDYINAALLGKLDYSDTTAFRTFSNALYFKLATNTLDDITAGAANVHLTTTLKSNYDAAYNERLRWDGGATGLVASTGRTSLGLGNVENTALSTWAGSSNITTLGTVANAGSITSSGLATFNGAGNNYFAGSLGVGTNSPAYPISLAFSNATTTQANFSGLLIGNTDPTVNNGSAISFAFSGISGNAYSRMGAIYEDRSGGSEDISLFFGTLGGGIYGERMRITSTGNVGINVTVPNAKLDIADLTAGVRSHISLKYGNANNDGAFINFSTAANDIIGRIEHKRIASGDYSLGFYTWVTSSSIEQMRITKNGIGINTTDLDGTPAIGRVTIKATANNGTSNGVVIRNSDETNVFRISDRGTLYLSGGFYPHITNNTNGYTPQPHDHRIYLNETAGGGDVFLPAGVDGWELTFTKTDASANAISLYPDGTETIVGESLYEITEQYQSITMQFNASTSTWYIISSYTKPAP
jgi:hypothetical protein